MKLEIKTNSAQSTEELGAIIGKNLKGGECIEFQSDLGGGKTTFVRGLVAGADGEEQVSSPTFTISQKYICKKFSVYHFDFYRLPDPGLIADELSEILSDGNNVTVVEWAESVEGVLPGNRLIIKITKDKTEENVRCFEFNVPADDGYLLEELK